MGFRDSWLPNIVVTAGNDVLIVAAPFAVTWIVRHRSALRATCVRLYQRLALFGRRLVPEPLPVGTPAAIATMMHTQPPFRLLRNPLGMQWQAHARQHGFDVQVYVPRAFRKGVNGHGRVLYKDPPYNHALYSSVSSPVCTTGTAEGPSLWE